MGDTERVFEDDERTVRSTPVVLETAGVATGMAATGGAGIPRCHGGRRRGARP
jgi:hypothetical protein